MADSPMETLEFCGFCGVLMPLEEERPLDSLTKEDDVVKHTKCPNCGHSTRNDLPIKGHFLSDDAQKLRCL